MLFPIQQLLKNKPEPVCTKPDMEATKALEIMHTHDFNHLPVVDSENRLVGLFNEQSLLKALIASGCSLCLLAVRDATTNVRSVSREENLFDILDYVEEAGIIVVVDSLKKVQGILTTYDTTSFFRQRSEDFMVIEDIETTIREFIETLYSSRSAKDAVTLEEALKRYANPGTRIQSQFVKALQVYLGITGLGKGLPLQQEAINKAFCKFETKSESKDFEKLSFDEFKEVLLAHPLCPKLGDENALRNLLERVRNIRNKLAHFRGEITAEERQVLKYCSEWLERSELTSDTMEPADSTGIAEVLPNLPPAEQEMQDSPSEEELDAEDGPYAKLALFLKKLNPRTKAKTLKFEEIEGLIGVPLPKAALVHRSWWANDPTNPQAQQWLDVGWRTSRVNIGEATLEFVRMKERQQPYIVFFSRVLAKLKLDAPQIPWKSISPQGVGWHRFAAFPESAESAQFIYLNISFNRKERVRVELYIDTGDVTKNKDFFDRLQNCQPQLPVDLWKILSWERLDEKQSCRVALYADGSIDASDEELEVIEQWLVTNAVRLYKTFQPLIQNLV